MLDYLTRFFRFLLPILRRAAIEAAANELNRRARANRLSERTAYSRIRPRTSYDTPPGGYIDRVAHPDSNPPFVRDNAGFHDVLMIAFDVSGPDARSAEELLKNYLPDTGDITYKSKKFYLDSWWVANDIRFDESDTDSAVFVHKGMQKEARELLRAHGLAG
jgi:hypothetical protein